MRNVSFMIDVDEMILNAKQLYSVKGGVGDVYHEIFIHIALNAERVTDDEAWEKFFERSRP